MGGNVLAVGYNDATGIYAEGGYVQVVVDQNVTAVATYGNAIGVKVVGDSSITIGGNATAVSVFGDATAVYGNSTGYMGVHVGGNVYAGALGNATGVYVYAGGNSSVYVGGDVYAKDERPATGISNYADGYSTTHVVGNARPPHTSATRSAFTAGAKTQTPSTSTAM